MPAHRLCRTHGWPRLLLCQSTVPRACAEQAVPVWRAVRRRSATLTGLRAMTITYSCVANGRAVLAELALSGGAYQVPADRASASEGSVPRGWRPPGLAQDAGRPPRTLGPGQKLRARGGSCACATQGLGLVLHAGVWQRFITISKLIVLLQDFLRPEMTCSSAHT